MYFRRRKYISILIYKENKMKRDTIKGIKCIFLKSIDE